MLDLFRAEALKQESSNRFGRIVLVRPLSFTVYVMTSLTVVSILGFLLVYGQYTKKAHIIGLLVPNSGLIKVLSPSSGVLVETRVTEGDDVVADSVVVTLSTERASSSNQNTQMTVGRKLLERKSSLTNEIANAESLSRQQETTLSERVASISVEFAQTQREVETQRRRVLSSSDQVKRYRDLNAAKFFSDLQLLQKQDELLEQEARLQTIERNSLTLLRDLSQAKSDLKEIPLKRVRERALTERSIGLLEQEEVDNEAKRTVVIASPKTGVVTAILHKRGASIKAGDTLFTLLPNNLQLEAHLFAPSKSIGFIEIGQKVLLSYQAYPYQKFGQYKGSVAALSRAPLEPGELPSAIPGATNSGQALYRITVTLASQHAMAYGKPQRLQSGMLVEADVMQDTRTLLEWILEPLYSLKGRL